MKNKQYREGHERKRKLLRVSGRFGLSRVELPRVKLQHIFGGNPGEIEFGLS